MFNAGLQRGEREEREGKTGSRGFWGGVPCEIRVHLLVSKTDVDEYQPLKWASEANEAFI